MYNFVMVIDFHTHAYKGLIAKKAMAAVPQDSQYGPFYNCTEQGLLAKMDESGVDKAVVLNIANSPLSVTHVNDYAIKLLKYDRLIPFGSIHPDYHDPKGELNRLLSYKINRLKFHPYYQKCELLSKESYKLYELAANNDVIMLFHGGLDLMIKGYNSTPQKLLRIYEDFKGAKLVFAHLGGWGLWQDAFDLLVDKDVYLDTSFAFKFLDKEQIDFVLKNHNPDKLLFGTDSPWTDMKEELSHTLSLDYEYKDKLLYKNAQKLLAIV